MLATGAATLLAVPDRTVAERPEAKEPDGSDGQFAGLMAQWVQPPANPKAPEKSQAGPKETEPRSAPSATEGPASSVTTKDAAPTPDAKASPRPAAPPESAVSAAPVDPKMPAPLPALDPASLLPPVTAALPATSLITNLDPAPPAPATLTPTNPPGTLPPAPLPSLVPAGTPLPSVPATAPGDTEAVKAIPQPTTTPTDPLPLKPSLVTQAVLAEGVPKIKESIQIKEPVAVPEPPSPTPLPIQPAANQAGDKLPAPPEPHDLPGLLGLKQAKASMPAVTAEPVRDAMPVDSGPSKTGLLPQLQESLPALTTTVLTPMATPGHADGSAMAALSILPRAAQPTGSTPVVPPSAIPAMPTAPVVQVEGGLRWMLKGGAQEAQLQLHPDSLGQVTIHLRVEGGEVHARLWVTEPASVQAVQEGRPHLEASLKEQGLQLGSFDLQQGHRPFQEAPANSIFPDRPSLDALSARQETPSAPAPSILNAHHVELYA